MLQSFQNFQFLHQTAPVAYVDFLYCLLGMFLKQGKDFVTELIDLCPLIKEKDSIYHINVYKHSSRPPKFAMLR